MGLGGWLAGRSEVEHYDSERRREEREIITVPHREEREIEEIFEPYGMTKHDIAPLLAKLKADHEKWVDFMMKFELNLERPDPSRSWVCL
jgi:vacuolar iron transporter family protein